MSPIKLDLHVHTVYSGDSLIKPLDAIKIAKKKGLNGFAIVDHGNLKGYNITKKKASDCGLIIVPGIEIETHIGEVIGLFLENEIELKDNNFFSIVENIKDNNGLVLIPHPYDFLRSNHLKMELLNDRTIKKYVQGVEIINSRITFKRSVKKARDFKEKYNLFETGGSDAHTTKEIGNGYTFFREISEGSFDSIRKNLLSRKSKSIGILTNPLIHTLTILNKLKKGLYLKKSNS
jgi:predicted metal-dependent phosphoesterase TrpH